jgi:hypothetical protein
MILRFLAVSTALVGPFSVFADEVVLVNGDRISGAIVKGNGKTLTIKTEFLGVVSMPWNKVTSIKAEEPVHVVLSGGETVEGTIDTREDKLEIVAETERREAALAEVTALRSAAEQRMYERLLRPGWTNLWAGTATLGLAGTQGNAETRTFTTDVNAARITNYDKTTLHLNAIRAAAQLDEKTELTAQAVRGGLAYSRNVASRMSLNAFNDYEYDRFQNLDLRFVAGGGVSVSAWKSERGSLDGLAGGAYNRESFSASPEQAGFTRHSGEAYIGDDFTYKLTAVTAMYQNLRFFGNMTKLGRYRFNFDLGANTKLVQWLSWNISVSNRYLSAPVPGRQKNDFLYTTGIGVTFAR